MFFQSKRVKYWVAFLGFFITMGIIRMTTNYNQVTQESLNRLGEYEVLAMAFFVGFLALFVLFLADVYKDYWQRFFIISAWMEDLCLFFLFLVVVGVFLPIFFLGNGFMASTHLYVFHAKELTHVVPNLTAQDFLVLCMDNTNTMELTRVPPMNGHAIVAGMHEGKEYVCLDLQQLVNKSNLSSTSKAGIRAFFKTMGTNDISCVGLNELEKPVSKGWQIPPSQ